MNHLELLGNILVAFAEYYDKRLTTTQISMYVDDLAELTAEELTRACKLYRKDPANDRFPLPSKLIGLAQPKATSEDVGREISSRIIDALFKFGNNNGDRARESIGALGWEVIKRMGGWQNFCADVTDASLATVRAQLRDLAATIDRAEKRAIASGHVRLPAKGVPRQLSEAVEKVAQACSPIPMNTALNAAESEEHA